MASLGHTGRRVVLGHTFKYTNINENKQIKSHNVLSKFTILCWAAFIAILGCTWPRGHKLDTPTSIHKPPSASAEAAAHLLPWCLLPPSGLHPDMQEKETPAAKPVKGRLRDNWPQEAPGSKPTLPHPSPMEGIMKDCRIWMQNR